MPKTLNLLERKIKCISLIMQRLFIKLQKHKYFIKNQRKIQQKQKEYYCENIDFLREKVKDYEKNRHARNKPDISRKRVLW